MARTRSIKPDFFDDITLANCSPLARYLYPCIWCHVDGQQLIEADPRLHKKNAFPYDDSITVAQVQGWIDELVRERRLIRFMFDGRELLYCPKLKKHSRVYEDEPKKFNVPDDLIDSLKTSSPDLRTSAREPRGSSAVDVLEEAEAKAKKGECEGKKPPAEKPKKPVLELEAVFQEYPKRDNTGKSKGLTALRNQVKTPEDFELAKKAARNYAAYVELKSEEPTWKPDFVKQFKTWAGEWRDWIDWKPPPPKGKLRVAPPPKMAPLSSEGEILAEKIIAAIRSGGCGAQDLIAGQPRVAEWLREHFGTWRLLPIEQAERAVRMELAALERGEPDWFNQIQMPMEWLV